MSENKITEETKEQNKDNKEDKALKAENLKLKKQIEDGAKKLKELSDIILNKNEEILALEDKLAVPVASLDDNTAMVAGVLYDVVELNSAFDTMDRIKKSFIGHGDPVAVLRTR